MTIRKATIFGVAGLLFSGGAAAEPGTITVSAWPSTPP